MAVKTITIDMDAYNALRRHKDAGKSFSDVIKEHFGGRTTGTALARALVGLHLNDSTLDAVDRLVAERAHDAARSAAL